jgi:ankyrin repeat protein
LEELEAALAASRELPLVVLSSKNGAGSTPLHVAASQGNANILRCLLSALSSAPAATVVNIRRKTDSATALHCAAAPRGAAATPEAAMECGAWVFFFVLFEL